MRIEAGWTRVHIEFLDLRKRNPIGDGQRRRTHPSPRSFSKGCFSLLRGIFVGIVSIALAGSVTAVHDTSISLGFASPAKGDVDIQAKPNVERRQDEKPRQPVDPVDRDSGSKETRKTKADRATSAVIFASNEDYQIGANDVIEVTVEDAPELSRIFRLNASGSFMMPYVGRITALQKTAEELARAIADGLRKAEYLKEPQVSVEVKQYNSRTFFVQGAVHSPGIYQIEGHPSLLKLIIIAGGLDQNHGSTAFIIRETKPQASGSQDTGRTSATSDADGEATPKYELLTRSINGLLKGNFDQDLTIEPGDIVNIPLTDVFFVAGEVKAPGSFPLKEGTTVRQAISLAQGVTFKAAGDRGIIFREDPVNGKREEIHVDIGAVMSGKREDLRLMANDTILVPNSRLKSVGSVLLSAFGFSFIRRAGVPLGY